MGVTIKKGAVDDVAFMMLQTAVTNHAAKKVYEGIGWTKDDEFFVYTFNLVE